jgi:hypothetical protein
MADLVSRIGSSWRRRDLPTLAAAIPVAAFVMGMAGPAARADETRAESGFDEHRVEFHNQGVKLAGSLLCQEANRLFRPSSLSMARAHRLASRTVRLVQILRARVLPH